MIQTTPGGMSHADRGPVGSAAGPFPDPVPSSRLFRSGLSVPHSFFILFFATGVRAAQLFFLFMDQSLPLFSQSVSRGVCAQQILAATLWGILSWLVSQLGIGLFLPLFESVSEIGIQINCALLVKWILSSCCQIVAFGILCHIASARVIRNTMLIGLYWFVASVFVQALLILIMVKFEALWAASVSAILLYLSYLVVAYCISLILYNHRDQLKASSIPWIGLIVVLQAWMFTNWISYITVGGVHSSYISFFSLLFDILGAVAIFKLAGSGAFSGKFVEMPVQKDAYSPLNRYMLGFVIASVLVILLMLVYKRYFL